MVAVYLLDGVASGRESRLALRLEMRIRSHSKVPGKEMSRGEINRASEKISKTPLACDPVKGKRIPMNGRVIIRF
jgi:hypothetical protein